MKLQALARWTGWMWWALLAGLLIFNKPFATLGFPPLYISEIAIGIALLVALCQWKSAFLEPLQDSWAFRLIAAFGLLGVIRACFDARELGFMALRDSVIAAYGLTAFLAAYLWTIRIDRTPPMKTVRLCLPVVVSLAATWATLLVFGQINPAEWGAWSGLGQGKADLYAVAVATAAWVWLTRCGTWLPRGDDATSPKAWGLFALALGLSAVALFAMHRFQIRSVTLGLPLALAAAVIAFTYTLRRRILLGLLLAGVIVLAGPARLLRPLDIFKAVDTEYQLSAGLDPTPPPPSTDAPPVDAPPSTQPPAPVPTPVAPAPAVPDETPRQDIINPAPSNWQESLERMTSAFDPDLAKYQSAAGQAGVYNVRWRAAFWVRCCRVTLHRSPLLGMGFGRNLTEVMRDTPAWPIYVPSQQLVPPNRSPHCAHVTIFSRMGLVGLVLWLSILAVVSFGMFVKLWRCARTGTSEREKFWDGLMLLGVWLIFLSAMSFGVILEGPMGGIWFWSLTGFMARWSADA